MKAFEPVPTDLMVQQGPSCWLFVVEAVAHARLPQTRYLRMIMNAYASEDQISAAMATQRAPKPGRRTLALRITADNLMAFCNKLMVWDASEGGDRSKGVIAKNIVQRYARDTLGSETSVPFFSADPGPYEVGFVVSEYRQAYLRAELLHKLATTGTDEVAALLNTGSGTIFAGQAVSDARLALCDQSWPSYAGIKRRYKLGPGQLAPEVDLRGRSRDDLQDSVHAVLLHGFDPATDTVTYKDPNYGNHQLKVDTGQFIAMAGTEQITMRPFFTSGATRSRLAEVLDVPVN